MTKLPSNSQRIKHDEAATPANLFDEPFEKWWREYEAQVHQAMARGPGAWRCILSIAFVCGAAFGSRHVCGESTGPADEPGDNSDETNADRGRSC